MDMSLLGDYRSATSTTGDAATTILDLPNMVLDTVGQQISLMIEVFAADENLATAYWYQRLAIKKMPNSSVRLETAEVASSKSKAAKNWTVVFGFTGNHVSLVLTGDPSTNVFWNTRCNGFMFRP
jgi:hypothetical protein